MLQAAGATLYPDRVVIETQHQVKSGFWIVTDNVTVVAPDVTDAQLGETIRVHLRASKTNLPDPKDQAAFKANWERYKNAIGAKTDKEVLLNARFVSILADGEKLALSPTKNGGTAGDKKGHQYLPELAITLTGTISDMELGQKIREAWRACK